MIVLVMNGALVLILFMATFFYGLTLSKCLLCKIPSPQLYPYLAILIAVIIFVGITLPVGSMGWQEDNTHMLIGIVLLELLGMLLQLKYPILEDPYNSVISSLKRPAKIL